MDSKKVITSLVAISALIAIASYLFSAGLISAWFEIRWCVSINLGEFTCTGCLSSST